MSLQRPSQRLLGLGGLDLRIGLWLINQEPYIEGREDQVDLILDEVLVHKWRDPAIACVVSSRLPRYDHLDRLEHHQLHDALVVDVEILLEANLDVPKGAEESHRLEIGVEEIAVLASVGGDNLQHVFLHQVGMDQPPLLVEIPGALVSEPLSPHLLVPHVLPRNLVVSKIAAGWQ